MTFCTITPSRGGERKDFFEFCLKQLNKLNGGPPTNAYLMNEHPKNNEVDLVPRIREGIEFAKKDGFTHMFVVEDDDFYCADYLKTNLDFDFFGYSDSTYYNLRNKTYATFKHPNRSSLFTTAFKISALDHFPWPGDATVFLDVKLWEWATRKRFNVRLLKDNPCLGIKHSVGKCGGKGHRMTMKNKDSDLSFLKSRVDSDAYEFYTKLMLTL